MKPQLFIKPERMTEPIVVLLPEEIHYIRNVLRLVKGDFLSVADGKGERFSAQLEDIDRKKGIIPWC